MTSRGMLPLPLLLLALLSEVAGHRFRTASAAFGNSAVSPKLNQLNDSRVAVVQQHDHGHGSGNATNMSQHAAAQAAVDEDEEGNIVQHHDEEGKRILLVSTNSAGAVSTMKVPGSNGADATPPVSHVMRCVTTLIVLYFGVYLGFIFARGWSVVSGKMSRGRGYSTESRLEAMLQDSTETLAFVPMTCILMISARQRAMQLTPDGIMQVWASSSMYFCTGAILAQFIVQFVSSYAFNRGGAAVHGSEGGFSPLQVVVNGLRCCAIALLYACFAVIAASVYLIQAPDGQKTPPVSPTMQCTCILTTLYFLIHLGIIIMRCKNRWFPEEQGGPGERHRDLSANVLEQASATLAFAPMFCVLMVGTRMRALQIGQEPPAWAQVAMYVATWSIVAQAVLIAVLLHFLRKPFHEELKDDDDAYKLDWPNVESCERSLVGLMAVRSFAVLAMYAAIGVVLTAIFVVEEKPLTFLHPELQENALKLVGQVLRGTAAQLPELPAVASQSAAQVPRDVPPLSSAMRCVTTLTVVYFATYLAILIARTLQQCKLFKLAYSRSSAREPPRTSSRAEFVLQGTTRALAFAPMLCVMMIGLRFRAQQLGVRDPQYWAQTAMYVSTYSILVQILMIVAAACFWDDRGADAQVYLDEGHAVLLKLCAIVFHINRYLALMCIYCGMAVLVVALFLMKHERT